MPKTHIIKLAAKLKQKANRLPSIPTSQREIIGVGRHSIALDNSDSTILLVTSLKTASKIELLRSKIRSKKLSNQLDIPTFVGCHANLGQLINPSLPKKKIRSRTKLILASADSRLWRTNVVYCMKKYHGSLEDFSEVSFTTSTIKKCLQELSQIVYSLHDLNITHNDVACRNVLWRGSFPNFKFTITDWSSMSINQNNQAHLLRIEKDLKGLCQIEAKLNKIRSSMPVSPKDKALAPTILFSRTGRKIKQLGLEKKILDFSTLALEDHEKENISDTSNELIDDRVDKKTAIFTKS